MKEYRETHREEKKINDKEYREKNKEQVRLSKQQWYEKNKEKVKQRVKENREKKRLEGYTFKLIILLFDNIIKLNSNYKVE